MPNTQHLPAGNSNGGQFAPKNFGWENYDTTAILPKPKKVSKNKKKLKKLVRENVPAVLLSTVTVDVNTLYHCLSHGHKHMVNKQGINHALQALSSPTAVYQESDNRNYCYYIDLYPDKPYGKRGRYFKVVVNPFKKRVVTFFPTKKISELEKDKLYDRQTITS